MVGKLSFPLHKTDRQFSTKTLDSKIIFLYVCTQILQAGVVDVVNETDKSSFYKDSFLPIIKR